MKELVINVSPGETRIAFVENNRLAELQIERQENPSQVGNIYLGRVDAIVPGMQSAFIDYGDDKNGFLYVSDIAGAEGTGDVVLEDGIPRAKTRAARARQQPIETMLKKGQTVMVQVMKDRLGTKGARLTNFITIPGRYMVLMPTVTTLGVSRKIDSPNERERLRKVLSQVRPKGVGLITRTAGEGRTKEELEGDAKFLTREWSRVKEKFERLNKPGLLREDLNPVLRIVRDRFTSDFTRLTLDSETEFAKVEHFLESLAPALKKHVKMYKGKRPLFDKMGIEREIEKALQRSVTLKSGGHIVIDQTEALIAIDVNTGRFTGRKQLEDTVLQTNLEAADEIARQVRLRDMGGIIVIDFIDMEYSRNRQKLIQTLSEALRHDHSKTTLSEVNELGMVMMTRKRVKHNLVKALSQPCPYCKGGGMVKSVTTVTFDTLRTLESLLCHTREKGIILQAHPDVARRLRTENRATIEEAALHFGREIEIEAMPDFHIHDVKFLRARTRKEITFEAE